MIRPPPRSTLFPYPPLFRSEPRRRGHHADLGEPRGLVECHVTKVSRPVVLEQIAPRREAVAARHRTASHEQIEDRKSTRLNSSHSQISYAVFCLKKKQHMALQHLPKRGAVRRARNPGSQISILS